MSKNVSWEEIRLFDVPEQEPETRSTVKRSRLAMYGMPLPPGVVDSVWAHYLSTFPSKRKPHLSVDRVRLITMAVNEYGVDVVKQAITGCSLSNWHMGNNPAGRRYTGIELILRDSAHIERFVEFAVGGESRGGFLDED